ncbi:hypothetical protein [Pelistega ratti]|uniref:hypothetical protein n=1 Tax=Pelistega ratti TaxID=2652177 RepID=UPI001358714C|nr:hypothetical protein [Pelistega ratti]
MGQEIEYSLYLIENIKFLFLCVFLPAFITRIIIKGIMILRYGEENNKKIHENLVLFIFPLMVVLSIFLTKDSVFS